MKTVSVQLPESFVGTGGGSEEGLSRESQFLLALKLFELGRLSAKEAAAMCGVNVVDFLLYAEKAVLPVDATRRNGTHSAASTVSAAAPLTGSGSSCPAGTYDGRALL